MRIVATILALLLASAALAGNAHVVPAGPTTATPIDVHYRAICAPRDHAVTREGSLIRVTVLDPACVIVLPIPTVETVRLPELLPVGEYRVEVWLEGSTQTPFATTEFVVRNAAPKPFEVHPFAVFGGVPVRLNGVTCEEAECSDLTVRVGGAAVNFTVDNDGALRFLAPPQDAGLADVTVTRSDFTSVSPGALYYFEEADPSVFEAVLFPVLFSSDGAHGSQWRSEGMISNPNPWSVDNANTIGPLHHCIAYPCGERLFPKSEEPLSDHFPRGALLRVPRPEAPDLAFALRIRDISRHADGFGTRVPVVRERDMIHGRSISLLDVPLDPRYRTKVRIYMIEPAFDQHYGGSVALQRESGTLQLPFTLTREPDFIGRTNNVPYFAEVDLPQGSAHERVNVSIEMPLDAIGWAFASVTNNDTQEVTIVAPR